MTRMSSLTTDGSDCSSIAIRPFACLAWLGGASANKTEAASRTRACCARRSVQRLRPGSHHVGAEVHAGAPRVSAELPDTGERFEGLIPPLVTAPAFAIRKPAVAVFSLDDYVGRGNHDGRTSRDPAGRRRRAPQYSGRRRHLDRQDDARQRAARRGRQDRRPRRADRGHARTAMPGAELRRAADQGRRRLAFRPRAFIASAAPRPHPRSGRCAAKRRSTC